MSAPIRVLIRADAGAAIGTGHFARASAVAEALAARGNAEIALAFDADGAALVPAIFPAGLRLVPLGRDSNAPDAALRTVSSEAWLPEVIYLDQYGAVPEWEALASANGIPLLVIDDLDAARKAELIVRPHDGSAGDAGVLTGPAYVPLSPRLTGTDSAARQGDRLRLNICFGGSDPTGETAKALQAVAGLNGIDVDVAIGPGASIDPGLIDAARAAPHVTLHHAPSQGRLAELMASADLALGAGGVMLWERLYLGLPSLVIATARNQQAQIGSMVAAGAIRFIGDHAKVTADTIAEAVVALAADRAARQAMAELGPKLVDGRGAVRLAAAIKGLALNLRDVQPGDGEELLEWRTDPRNWQHNFAEAEKPDLPAHLAWLNARLADPACVFRLVLRGTEPVGVVRFDLDETGAAAYLSIYLVPRWHGHGMGLPVYFAAERALRHSHPGVKRIVSRIEAANASSVRLHRDAGFEIAPSADRAGWCDATRALG